MSTKSKAVKASANGTDPAEELRRRIAALEGEAAKRSGLVLQAQGILAEYNALQAKVNGLRTALELIAPPADAEEV